jgi:hypothetical protein
MTDLQQFIKTNCVWSKLSEKPVVRQWKHLELVFVHGYPMTLRAFYILCNKAVFGNTLYLRGKIWNELHAETKLLCRGMNHNLIEGREAFSIVDGIRAAIGWDKNTAKASLGYHYNTEPTKPVQHWLEDVERQIAALRGVTLPGPQLR